MTGSVSRQCGVSSIADSLSLVCCADAGAYWQSVDANKILGCSFPSFSGFSIDWCETDSQRRSDLHGFPPLSHMFSVSCLLLVFRLLAESRPSDRVSTHQRCRRHIVFITRLLPTGPGLALIGWLTWMSRLNMQHFPFSSLSRQEIRSVTAQRIQAGTCVHSILSQLCRLARTCTSKPRRKGAVFFKMRELLFLFLLSSCTLLHPFSMSRTINLRYWYCDCCTTVVTIDKINT